MIADRSPMMRVIRVMMYLISTDLEGCNGGRWRARIGHVILPKGHGQITATMGVNKSIVACMIA